MRIIDLRSDTSSLPPQGMLDAMRQAELGNDGYHEDPTTNELEDLSASMLGKEAGLFVASGTMGNLVSLMAYLGQGDRFVAEERAHIIRNEHGYAEIIRARPIPAASSLGSISTEILEKALHDDDSSKDAVKLVCIENTHAYYGGTVVSTRDMAAIYECAKRFGKPVHLDGSRIFNAAEKLRIDAKEISQSADSVMFCLSKGLCAPVGSIVVGTSEFVEKARGRRKVVGGAMRQTGVVAAGGLWALKNMVGRIGEDRKNASILARGLAELGSDDLLSIDLQTVQTNIILAKTRQKALTAQELSRRLAPFGVKIGLRSETELRCVTHNDVSEEDIYYVLDAFKDIVREYH